MCRFISIVLMLTALALSGCKSSSKGDAESGDGSQPSDTIAVSASDQTREDYQEMLGLFLDKIKENQMLSSGEIILAIPQTMAEYVQYHKLAFPKDAAARNEFSILEKDIQMLAGTGVSEAFEGYLAMAEFVEGEYADSYFRDVENVISPNSDQFCLVYPTLSSTCIRRLESYFVAYCN